MSGLMDNILSSPSRDNTSLVVEVVEVEVEEVVEEVEVVEE